MLLVDDLNYVFTLNKEYKHCREIHCHLWIFSIVDKDNPEYAEFELSKLLWKIGRDKNGNPNATKLVLSIF